MTIVRTRLLGSGRKTVTTAGTAVALVATSTSCQWVSVQALKANTGYIAVGSSAVVAAGGSEKGTVLGIPVSGSAGDTVVVWVDDLTKVYIDSTVSGEGVSYTYGL